jgi:hypothetical protein
MFDIWDEEEDEDMCPECKGRGLVLCVMCEDDVPDEDATTCSYCVGSMEVGCP